MKRLLRVRRRHLMRWLPMAWLIVIVILFGYIALQQTIRADADQPQAAMVREAVNALHDGTKPGVLVDTPTRNIADSLSSFLIIYNESYTPIAGNGILDDKLPNIPSGSLTYAKTHGENRVTWEPKEGVRIATVIRSYEFGGKTGYVVAGRNLEEAEAQVARLTLFMIAGSFAALLGSLGLVIISDEYVPVP